MDGHYSRSAIAHLRNEFHRVNSHEVHVKRFGRGGADGFDCRKSECYIGHEYSVHEVDMQVVGFAGVYESDCTLQVSEVGG